MSIEQKMKKGVIWITISRVVSRTLQFISFIVLARILSPHDFGVAAMAIIIIRFIKRFGRFGIGTVIIQKQKEVNRYSNAAFWMNMLLAIFLVIATISIAPFVANFYKNPLVKPILIVLSFGFLFEFLGTVHTALLTKEFEFKKLARVNLLTESLTAIMAIAMALCGFKIWSLVVPRIISSALRSIILWNICSWRPSFKFSTKFRYSREIFNFGRFIFGSEILRYFNQSFDCIILGRFLGPISLGLYTFAYKLGGFLTDNINYVLHRVALPAFSKLQNEEKNLKELYLKIKKIISLISFPVFIGLAAIANELVPIVFSEKWMPAILPLQILVFYFIIYSFRPLGAMLLRALGRPDKEFKLNLIQAPFFIIAVLIGIKFGVVGVAIATAVVLGSGGFIFICITNRSIGVKCKEAFGIIQPAAISSLLMLTGILLSKYLFLRFHLNISYLILILLIILGAIMYFGTLYLLFRKTFRELISLFKNMYALFFKDIKTFMSSKAYFSFMR